jgi:hypothetical protein
VYHLAATSSPATTSATATAAGQGESKRHTGEDCGDHEESHFDEMQLL